MGKPFVPFAAAGSLLERAFRLARFNRSQFRISNILSCAPPNDFLVGAPYELDAINHCQMHRDKVVGEARPRAILALGATALRVLTGYTGRKQGISELRGYVLPSLDWGRIPVIASFHPAFIRRGKMNLLPVLLHDLKKAVAVAQGAYSDYVWDDPQAKLPDYHTTPSVDEARSLLFRVQEGSVDLLTYDIETPHSKGADEDEELEEATTSDHSILSIQFSTRPEEGYFFPYQEPYIGIARDLLASGVRKAGHNSKRFDNPRLEAAGFEIRGEVHDTLQLWKHLQPDLPAGLQSVGSFFGMPFPWKHMAGSEPEFYGCVDVDAPQRIFRQGMVQLEQAGLAEGYMRLRVALEPALMSTTRRGIPIDTVARQELKDYLEGEGARLDGEIDLLAPAEICKLHKKEGYKGIPPKLKVLLEEGRAGEVQLDNDGKRFQYVQVEGRWNRRYFFNVSGSAPDTLRYIKLRGYPVPTNRKSKEETTADEELERLATKTGDPLLRLILERRALRTMMSMHFNAWEPTEQGLVHGYYFDKLGTGQLASGGAGPNVLNPPKHGELAKRFRKMIAAQPGHTLIEIDLSSAHALTLGWCAKDESYMRAARLDIHSLLSGQVLKLHEVQRMLEKSDGELKDYFKWYKSDADRKFHRDKKAKPTILGYGFGMRENTLYETNRESFENKAEAKRLLEMLDGAFPVTAQWRKDIQQVAHRQQYLKSPWGFIRRFYAVFESDPKTGQLKGGDDAQAAIAFLPANCAFGHMRSCWVDFKERGWDERYWLALSLHDQFFWHCRNELVEEALETIYGRMTSPVPELDGLAFGAECLVGNTWATMSPVTVGE
jgi:uracil-DNA glycosylase family 4